MASKCTTTTFEDFYGAHQVQLVRTLRRILDSDQSAEEAAQEAFGQVWQRWDEISDPANYLYRVGFNKANDELRRRTSRRSKDHLLRPQQDPETIYLSDALKQVTKKQRTALYLKFFEDSTTNEIADAMDIPAGTAKSLIHRGLVNLRQQVQLEPTPVRI